MDTVRRLYLYAMSAVSLAVLAVGAQALLTVALHGLGLRGVPVFGGDPGDRQALSLAIALVGVGLPVWAIHWWLVERSVRRGADAEAERRAGIRAFYLSAVLAVFILVAAIAAMSLVRIVVSRLMPLSDDYYGYEDLAGTISTLFVVAAGWALHAQTRRVDVAGGELHGGAAWLPRLYRYVVTFFGLVIFAQGLGEIAKVAIVYVSGTSSPDAIYGGGYAYQLRQALPAAIVGLAAWVSHAWASDRVAASDGWHGASEQTSRIRLGYWPLVIAVAAFASIMSLAGGLAVLLGQVLGTITELSASLAVQIAAAAAAAVPWLAIWWLHGRWGRDAASATGDPGRRTFAARLDRHVGAAVGLAFGAIATGWLVGVLIDVVLGGSRTVGDGWRHELSQFLAWAVLGLPLWIWNWSRLLALRQADPAGEASSAVRRAYLLLAIGVAIVSTLGSLAIVLYRLVGYLLGAGLGGNAVSELSTPLGALIAAAAIVVYHGLQLRSDGELRPAAAEAAAPVAAPLTAAVPPAAMAAEDTAARISLELRGPTGADLEATLAMLRGVLPEGQTLAEG